MIERRDPAEAQPRGADLRRRLYRADATDEDVQRYLAEQEAEEPPIADEPAAPPRIRRPAVIGGVLVLVAVGTLVVGVRLSQPPGPSPTASTTADARLLEGIDGPVAVSVPIDGTAVPGQRFRGTGSADVDVAAPQGAFDGGRILVDVTTSGSARVGWTATSLVSQTDWTTFHDEIAAGAAWTPFGSAEPTWSSYPAQPPTRIAIDAPEGIGWTLVVAFSDTDSPVEP